MKELADLLERIDAYFEGKSSTERLALILLPALLVGYLVWTLMTPQAEARYNRSVADKKQAQKRLLEDKKYLQGITVNGDRDYHLKAYDQKIALAKKRAGDYRTKITLLDKNLNKLSDMLFNQKSWSLFLDSITSRAHERSVEIVTIQNQYVDSNGSFGHVLEVGLHCRGDFTGIVRFVNDLEQNTLVTDVYESRIYTEENGTQVLADINISVWGVNH
jgi:hypothetical protein